MTSNQAAKVIADKMPPHDIAAEQALLGCIVMAPEDCLGECAEKMRPGRLCFYDIRHQHIFEAMTDIHRECGKIDLITLQSELKRQGLLEQIGGMGYLAGLPDAAPSAANLEFYIGIVLDKYVLRKMVQTCTGISARAMAHDGQSKELMADMEREVLAIGNHLETGRGVADLGALYQTLITDYENALENKQSGISTGFSDLDEMTGGMQPQEMIVLAGQQSTGKTSLAMNIASNLAFGGKTVGVISLETSAKKLLHRLFCARGEMDGSYFLRGRNIPEGHFKKMTVAAGQVLKIKERFLIDDSGGLTTEQILAKARRMRQSGACLIIIDYLQLISVRGATTDVERITEISRTIKACAKENNIPVLVISSLNREAAKGERRPQMHDLRGSGQIEYDGNQVWLLSCENTESSCRDVKLDVKKNKDGSTGLVELVFFAPQFRFENAAKPEQRRSYND